MIVFRSILFNLFFWPGFALYLTVSYPFIFFMNQRNTYKFGFKVVTKWLLLCLSFFVNLKYRIENISLLKETLQRGPVIIGCNHQSTWETFIFSLLFDRLSIVIKKELLKVPIAGLYFRRLLCIPIDRSSPIKAIKDLMKYGKKSVDDNISILIFPNGTRSAPEEDAEYKGGIYAMYRYLNIPVIPAHVDSGKFWPRRSFKKNPGTITLSFKVPIQPGLGKEEFMNRFKTEVDSSI